MYNMRNVQLCEMTALDEVFFFYQIRLISVNQPGKAISTCSVQNVARGCLGMVVSVVHINWKMSR